MLAGQVRSLATIFRCSSQVPVDHPGHIQYTGLAFLDFSSQLNSNANTAVREPPLGPDRGLFLRRYFATRPFLKLKMANPNDKEAADRNGEISVGTVVGFLYPFCS